MASSLVSGTSKYNRLATEKTVYYYDKIYQCVNKVDVLFRGVSIYQTMHPSITHTILLVPLIIFPVISISGRLS